MASRPDGGACHFLRDLRCSCHDVRPATCAEFPIVAHASDRLQLSLVLGCPGVELAALDRWAEGVPPDAPADGLETELAAVAREVERALAEGELARAARRWHRLRASIRRSSGGARGSDPRAPLYPVSEDLIPTDLAKAQLLDTEGDRIDLDGLPLAYDARWGRLAWRSHPGGVEFLSLEATGGAGPAREVLPLPARSPGLDGPARLRLRGYLGYRLARDQSLGTAYEELRSTGESQVSLRDVLLADLQSTAGQVLSLAILRRALTTDRRGPLTREDIDLGIRATDMDALDRPTVGLRL